MATLNAVEKLAMELPDHQRAALAVHMLHSLPGLFAEADGGLAEAERRDAELDVNPAMALSTEELDLRVANRRTG
jgi:hypothetical protein